MEENQAIVITDDLPLFMVSYLFVNKIYDSFYTLHLSTILMKKTYRKGVCVTFLLKAAKIHNKFILKKLPYFDIILGYQLQNKHEF